MTQQPMEQIKNLEAAIEAILYAAGHPITYQKLSDVLGLTVRDIKKMTEHMAESYNKESSGRGIMLLCFDDSCQLCTKEHYLNEIRDALGIRKSGSLSTSSMEVLAIVAYNQPVTRAFVDTLRRVDSSYAMNNLLDRGLITATGRLDVPGRPMLYGTTSDFLRCFGLNDLDSLPKTSDELMEAFEGAKAQEETVSEETAELIKDAEQLTLDIDNAIDGVVADETPVGEVNETAEETPENSEENEATEEFLEFEDPSADDDIHED